MSSTFGARNVRLPKINFSLRTSGERPFRGRIAAHGRRDVREAVFDVRKTNSILIRIAGIAKRCSEWPLWVRFSLCSWFNVAWIDRIALKADGLKTDPQFRFKPLISCLSPCWSKEKDDVLICTESRTHTLEQRKADRSETAFAATPCLGDENTATVDRAQSRSDVVQSDDR